MKKRFLSVAMLLLSIHFSAFAQVGTWKAYMAYSNVSDVVEANNLIYVLASDNLYAYNKNDKSIQTFDKMTGLNDCEISKISNNKNNKRLVIVYSNEDIDLMSLNGEVNNISDYYTASLTVDKTINHIYQYGNYAYLSTGFGIVKLNVKDAEISDTYNLGFKVNWCEINGNYIYAYSSTNGKYQALLSDNLLDKSNWNKIGDYTAETQENKDSLRNFVATLSPDGPKYNYFAFMKYTNGSLYTCGGGYKGINELSRPGIIQVLKNNDWKIYEDSLEAKTGHSYVDVTSLAIDPTNTNHVFAGSRAGLYEFKDGVFVKEYS